MSEGDEEKVCWRPGAGDLLHYLLRASGRPGARLSAPRGLKINRKSRLRYLHTLIGL